MMHTTLNKIRSFGPCASGWKKLLQTLGKTEADDEPVSILQILESNGLRDALWCLRAVEECDREIQLYMVWCARQVQHLMKDSRSIKALDVTEAYANGQATNEELRVAKNAAAAAAYAAVAAYAADADAYAYAAAAAAAADAAAYAAYAAAAADAAAYAAAVAAAADAAADAAEAAEAAAAAADAADAAEAAARKAQEVELRRLLKKLQEAA